MNATTSTATVTAAHVIASVGDTPKSCERTRVVVQKDAPSPPSSPIATGSMLWRKTSCTSRDAGAPSARLIPDPAAGRRTR